MFGRGLIGFKGEPTSWNLFLESRWVDSFLNKSVSICQHVPTLQAETSKQDIWREMNRKDTERLDVGNLCGTSEFSETSPPIDNRVGGEEEGKLPLFNHQLTKYPIACIASILFLNWGFSYLPKVLGSLLRGLKQS